MLSCALLRWAEWKRALKLSAVVNLVSYSVLGVLAFFVSNFSILTNARLMPDLSFVHTRRAVVYYLDPIGAAVWKVRLDGSPPQQVLKLQEPPEEHDVVSHPDLYPNYDNASGKWYLYAGNQRVTELSGRFWKPDDEGRRRTWYSVDLREPDSRTFKVWTGFWAGEGLRIDWESGERLHLGLEVPGFAWPVRSATVLPHGEIVFQLERQIMIYQVPTRRLGWIADGYSPLVVLQEATGNR